MIDYLFIRLLEACNAGCFMCGYANSKDEYRLNENEFYKIVKEAKKQGIKYIRFTGGEPLLDENIFKYLKIIKENGIKSSIISNGLLLEDKIDELCKAGLDQIIVSLDGPYEIHDEIRNRKGLFDKAIRGLQKANDLGIYTRVNTVCGPRNYKFIPELQRILTKNNIKQWEMSSLKLGGKLDYTNEDLTQIEHVIEYVYIDAKENGRLIPYGKVWCGNTKEERELYFSTGITPKPDKRCNVVDKVRYYDAKAKKMYACSLIPHRVEAENHCVTYENIENFNINNENMIKQVEFFKEKGPDVCTGCSTTACGYSNQIESNEFVKEWSY